MVMHIPTAWVMASLVVSIMAVVMLMFWRFNRNLPGMNDWGLAALSGPFMLLSIGLRDRLPELLAVMLTNGTLFLMPYLAWTGCRAYLGLPRPSWRWALWVGCAFLVLIAYFTVVYPSMNVRVVLQSWMAGGLFVLAAKTMLVGGWHRYPARYLFAIAVAVHALFMLVARPWLLITSNGGAAAQQLVVGGWILLESMVFFMLAGISMMALANEYFSAKLLALTEIDPLTKVFNRRAFMTLLNKACSRCEREGLPLSVLLIDLDHFKRINDSWGHQAGDQVLCRFAALTGAALRNEDVMGRLGGEEFCILLPGVRLADAKDIAERLRQTCEAEAVVFEGVQIRYTISIGIAQLEASESPQSALHRADRAMYRAKFIGRNRTELAPLTSQDNSARLHPA